MNDNDIIRALECCTTECRDVKCNNCLAFVDSRCTLKPKMLLGLINRQQAENERLKKHNTEMAFKHHRDGAKEFAKRLKEMYTGEKYNRPNAHTLLLKLFDNIDNFLEEMEKENE